MKKFYFILMTMATLASATVWSQVNWIGPASGGDWTVGANWTGGTVPDATSNVVFNGISGTITNVPTVTIRTLTVTGNSIVTLAYTGAAPNHILTISNGVSNASIDFAIDAGSEVIIGGGPAFTGVYLASQASALIAGKLTIGTGGKTYNTNTNNNTTVTGTGIVENKGNLISSSAARMTFQSGATYLHAANGGNIPYATWDPNSNFVVTGTINAIPTPTRFNQTFGNFHWNSPGQLQFTPSALNGVLDDIAGNFIMESTGTGHLSLGNTENFQLDVDNNYIQTGGTLTLSEVSGNGRINIGGDFAMNGGTIGTNGGGNNDVRFAGTNVHNLNKTGGTVTGALVFEVQTGQTIAMGASSVLDGAAASFILNDQAKIITAHPGGLNSTGPTGAIQTGARDFSDKSDYEFQGASTGVFNTGTSTNATPSIVRSLTINSTSGPVTLSKPVTITPNGGVGRVYLQNGILLTTATNILTLNDDVIATGVVAFTPNSYSLTSFVDGPLRKVGNDAFVFPVGQAGVGLRRIAIGGPLTPGANNTTSFTADFFRNTAQVFGNNLTGGLTQVSSCEYWTLDRSGTNQVRVILYWTNTSQCGTSPYVTDGLTLRVARYNGTAWVNEGRLTHTGATPAAGSITSGTYINSFSPFALGSESATENPLPVVFANLKAYGTNGGIQVEWSNMTEKDVDNYEVERSANGSDYDAISQQSPTSNQNDRVDYSSFDANPGSGVNYYRIKATETTGKVVYSKILTVDLGNGSQGFRMYPNPVTGNQVTISLSNVKRGQYTVRVTNTSGQDLFQQIINNQSTTMTQTLDLPSSIKAGVYYMVVSGSEFREIKKFIVR